MEQINRNYLKLNTNNIYIILFKKLNFDYIKRQESRKSMRSKTNIEIY